MNAEELAKLLRERGHRLTPQRFELLKLLPSLRQPTAEEIYARLREPFPYVSRATVYNTLKLLMELGAVSELGGGGRVRRYEAASERRCRFTCTRCGAVSEMEEAEPGWARELPRRFGGFRIDSCRIELAGLCPACLREPQDGTQAK